MTNTNWRETAVVLCDVFPGRTTSQCQQNWHNHKKTHRKYVDTHTHTHTHTHLTTPCPGLPGWACTRKVKPIWIILDQETVSGSGISWAICVSTSLQTDNHASTPLLSFLQAGCPSCRPTNSVKALKGSKYADNRSKTGQRRDLVGFELKRFF